MSSVEKENLRVRVLKRNLCLKYKEIYQQQYKDQLKMKSMKPKKRSSTTVEKARKKLGRVNMLTAEKNNTETHSKLKEDSSPTKYFATFSFNKVFDFIMTKIGISK